MQLACSEKFYSETQTFAKEIKYSDGPDSKLRNKYMMKLIHHFGTKHNTSFTCNYFATDHGKGVVDGIGGEAKKLVHQQVLIKIKNVQIAKDFATVVKLSC